MVVNPKIHSEKCLTSKFSDEKLPNLVFCNYLGFKLIRSDMVVNLELVSEELNHLAAILHVYAGGLIFMK